MEDGRSSDDDIRTGVEDIRYIHKFDAAVNFYICLEMAGGQNVTQLV